MIGRHKNMGKYTASKRKGIYVDLHTGRDRQGNGNNTDWGQTNAIWEGEATMF